MFLQPKSEGVLDVLNYIIAPLLISGALTVFLVIKAENPVNYLFRLATLSYTILALVVTLGLHPEVKSENKKFLSRSASSLLASGTLSLILISVPLLEVSQEMNAVLTFLTAWFFSAGIINLQPVANDFENVFDE